MVKVCEVCLTSNAVWIATDSDGDNVAVCEECERVYYRDHPLWKQGVDSESMGY